MQGAGVQLWGWDSTNSVWVKVLVNADGKLIIDPSEILEDTPTDGETAKAPTSNWAYDHAANTSAHHARYTDAEAIAAAKTDSTLLNYTEGARVYNSADQDIAHDTFLYVAFNSERWDTDSIHDTSTNNSRLTCQTAGKYVITGHIRFSENTTGRRYIEIMLNRTSSIAIMDMPPASTGHSIITIATIYDLAVGDYVEIRALQTSGSTLKVKAYAQYTPEFAIQRIG